MNYRYPGKLHTRDFIFAGAIVHNGSKIVVGNGGLNSKIFSAHYA